MMDLNSINGKRIVLIGGGGFIGHNLALTLKQHGANVSIIDGLSINNLLYFSSLGYDTVHRNRYLKMINQRLELLHKAEIPLLVQDARDYHALCKILSNLDPQVIVLMAAVSHAGRSNKDPYSTFDHSLRTLENALDFARTKCEHFIFFSSSMVYGNFETGMVDEEAPLDPIGIYGALKVGGEKLVIAYNQVFDLPYTIVRPSALYGERCVSRRVGQIFIENALEGKEVIIHGDGNDRLDFTYITDLTDALVRVIGNKNSMNQTFNLTYGRARSIRDLAEIIQSEFPDLSVSYKPKDVLMPDRGTLSIRKAREMLGYDPQFPIERGIPEYINWYRKFMPQTSPSAAEVESCDSLSSLPD